MLPLLTRLRFAAIPAIAVSASLLILWLYARFFYSTAWPALAPHVFLGWIAVLFLLTTAAAILWAAAAPQKSPGHPVTLSHCQNTFPAYALLVCSTGILLLLIALSTGLTTFLEVVRIDLVLAAWVAFWTLLTLLVRRFSTAFAAVLSLTCSAVLFAAPVTLAPLTHAVSRWGNPAHERSLDAVAYCAPILPALDALKFSVHEAAAWPEWTFMYRFTDLGQEIALRAHWHIALLLYAASALALFIFHCLLRIRTAVGKTGD